MELANMDAAFIWERNGRTYLFKGDKYWRFSGSKIDYGYPRSIRVWKGLPKRIDAAMKWKNGKSYFFAGPKYYRFDDLNVQVEAGYPHSIALKWMRCEKDMEVPKPIEAVFIIFFPVFAIMTLKYKKKNKIKERLSSTRGHGYVV